MHIEFDSESTVQVLAREFLAEAAASIHHSRYANEDIRHLWERLSTDLPLFRIMFYTRRMEPPSDAPSTIGPTLSSDAAELEIGVVLGGSDEITLVFRGCAGAFEYDELTDHLARSRRFLPM